MRKYAIRLSEKELMFLEHILWHFTDYMAGDNRPDHGMGILKQYRHLKEDDRLVINVLAGRLRRKWRKLKN